MRRSRSKARTDLLQGTLDLLILKTLALEPMHGYGIAQRIQVTSEELLKVEEGSLYPALYRLEEQGWIKAEWGSSKFYQLTAAGRRQLTAEISNWERLSLAISRVLATN
jgi:PadR family transcriptional regulator, regulatory protein PadR